MKKLGTNPYFYLTIAFVIMALLFYSSSQTYAEQSQIGLLEKVLQDQPLKEQLSKVSFKYAGSEVSLKTKDYFSFVEFFIRKGAHFLTYFILGGSFALALYYKQKNIWWGGVFGWLAATGYAATDEFHQMLTGGRTPMFQDVMLDSFGALTAILLIILWLLITKRRTH